MDLRDMIIDRLSAFSPTTTEGQGQPSAVAVTVAVEDGVPGIWLTRRAATLRSHAGQFAFPGGRVDEGEDVVTAALRELHEELGVRIDPSDVLGSLDDYPTRSGYVMSPVVVWAGERSSELSPNPAEVADVFTLTFDEIDVEPHFDEIPESPRPVIRLPMRGRFLHAPTAAVLYQFREVALHGRGTRVADLEQPPFAWR